MKGLNNAYVESIIRKAISGSISTTHVAARLGIAKQCVNKPNKCKDCIEKVRHRSRSKEGESRRVLQIGASMQPWLWGPAWR